MDKPASLMDHLLEQGYEPQDGTDWYDLTVSGTGTVRVCLRPDSEYSADVYLFDAHMANEWGANLSPGTPETVIIAIVEAGEWELANRRGFPVTPAQAKSA